MEQVAWTLAGETAPPSEPVKKLRSVAAPVTLRLEVTDAESALVGCVESCFTS